MVSKKSDGLDLQLQKVFKYGDEVAYRSIFYDFFAPLCVYAYRFIEDTDLCQDIVQDVFVKIWVKRHELKIHTSGKGFLLTLVRNACLDEIRRQTVELKWQEYSKHMYEGSENYDLYTTEELKEMLYGALNKLPEKVSEVFKMNRFQGKTYAEIALEKQISEKTVESYMTKTLRFLKDELKDFLTFLLFFYI